MSKCMAKLKMTICGSVLRVLCKIVNIRICAIRIPLKPRWSNCPTFRIAHATKSADSNAVYLNGPHFPNSGNNPY